MLQSLICSVMLQMLQWLLADADALASRMMLMVWPLKLLQVSPGSRSQQQQSCYLLVAAPPHLVYSTLSVRVYIDNYFLTAENKSHCADDNLRR